MKTLVSPSVIYSYSVSPHCNKNIHKVPPQLPSVKCRGSPNWDGTYLTCCSTLPCGISRSIPPSRGVVFPVVNYPYGGPIGDFSLVCGLREFPVLKSLDSFRSHHTIYTLQIYSSCVAMVGMMESFRLYFLVPSDSLYLSL